MVDYVALEDFRLKGKQLVKAWTVFRTNISLISYVRVADKATETPTVQYECGFSCSEIKVTSFSSSPVEEVAEVEETVDYKQLTKREIKDLLDEAGVEYDETERKDILIDRLESLGEIE